MTFLPFWSNVSVFRRTTLCVLLSFSSPDTDLIMGRDKIDTLELIQSFDVVSV